MENGIDMGANVKKGNEWLLCMSEGAELKFVRHSLIYIKAGDEGCLIQIETKEKKERHYISPYSKGMLVTAPGSLMLQSGDLSYKKLDFTFLVKLQVFVDKSKKNAKSVSEKIKNTSETQSSGFLPAEITGRITSRKIEYWFLGNFLNSNFDVERFSNILKNNEWYALIDFLFEESCSDACQQLQNLCIRYGLSESHFRRLTKYALGKSAKVELREWRLARALFEMLESKDNLTTVAMNNGYASLSHFSNEIKRAFGVSPRELIKKL